MIEAMSEKRQPGVIGSLPSTRPHRRSGKRATPGSPAAATAPTSARPTARAKPPAQPEATATLKPAAKPEATATLKPPATAKPARAKPAAARTQAAQRARTRAPSPARDPAPPAPAPTSPGALQTAVEAAAELTEIGLRASARALRVALSRLPKP
jgi:hypothetical protein